MEKKDKTRKRRKTKPGKKKDSYCNERECVRLKRAKRASRSLASVTL